MCQRIWHGGDLLAEVDSDDVGALRGELDRVGPALTAGGAGDEGNFAPKRSHCSGPQLALGRVSRWNRLEHLDVRGAGEMTADLGEQLPKRGAAPWAVSASASAHCSMNTNVSPVWCNEYSSQPGSSWTASIAFTQAAQKCLHRFRLGGERGNDDDGHGNSSAVRGVNGTGFD